MAIDQNTTVQVITTTQIVGMSVGSVAAGSIITLFGIWLKSHFEAKENKKSRIFEARRKAYAGLIGHLNNSFAKYNFSLKNKSLEVKLNDLTEYSVSIDYELADALLLSSETVKDKLETYKQKIFLLQGHILGDHHNLELPSTFQNRAQESMKIHELAKEIIELIRTELGVK